jgi:hypothetical protein
LHSAVLLRPYPLEVQYSLPDGAVAFCDLAFNPAIDADVAELGVHLHDPNK